jgi:hypothetical protein
VLVDTLRDWFREQKFGGVSTFEAPPAAFDKNQPFRRVLPAAVRRHLSFRSSHLIGAEA